MRVRQPFPRGWFSITDMLAYRRLVRSLPDQASMVEVGVWLGRSLCSVADIVRRKGITVHAVDLFTKRLAVGHPPVKGGQLGVFRSNMSRFGLRPIIHRGASMDRVQDVPDVDLVFLDADHGYEALCDEIAVWRPKARLVIGGHDYDQPGCPGVWPGVKRAVDEIFPTAQTKGRVWWAAP